MAPRSAATHLGERGALPLSPSPTRSVIVLDGRAAAPSGVLICGERLPRDVLVRLAALSHQVRNIRRDQAAHPELSTRLEQVAADVDALIRSVYDETARHLAGRRR